MHIDRFNFLKVITYGKKNNYLLYKFFALEVDIVLSIRV